MVLFFVVLAGLDIAINRLNQIPIEHKRCGIGNITINEQQLYHLSVHSKFTLNVQNICLILGIEVRKMRMTTTLLLTFHRHKVA